MPRTFRYLEVELDRKVNKEGNYEGVPTGTFYVQTEWYTKKVDTTVEDNQEYCQITFTDLTDYWQVTPTRDLLVQTFPDSSALIEEARDRVMTDAFNGARHKGAAPCRLFIMKDAETGEMRVLIKTYLGNFPMRAGSFPAAKVDESEYAEIRKAWFKNSSQACTASLEAEYGHQKEINAAQRKIDELNETVERMNRETFENKLTMFSNFSKVLNAKKDKIIELTRSVEDLSRKRSHDEMEENEVKQEEQLQTMSQTIQKIQRVAKKQKTTVMQASSSKQIAESSSSTQVAVASSSRQITESSSSKKANGKAPAKNSIPPQSPPPYSSIDLTDILDDDDDYYNSNPPRNIKVEEKELTQEELDKLEYDSDEELYNLDLML